MFDIAICSKVPNTICTFWLLRNKEIMGGIIVYKSKASEFRGIIEIFIEEEYRKRWLAKDFARQIKKVVCDTLRQKNITEIRSAAIAKQSPRLLAFFGFERYNNVYYKLKI